MRDDWTQGIALWVMCFTTLVPTFVHVVWGLTIWQTQKSEHTLEAVNELRHMPPDAIPDDATRMHIARLILRGQRNGFARALLFVLPVTVALIYGLLQMVSMT